jgi:small multidrug resistance pump
MRSPANVKVQRLGKRSSNRICISASGALTRRSTVVWVHIQGVRRTLRYRLGRRCLGSISILFYRDKKMPAYLYLGTAILCEVIATSAMRASDGFTRLGPSVIVAFGYGLAFYLLSLTLRTVPLGIAYAVWSGLGIVLVSLVAYVVYDQSLDFAALAGMALILAGVVVMNVFSKATVH